MKLWRYVRVIGYRNEFRARLYYEPSNKICGGKQKQCWKRKKNDDPRIGSGVRQGASHDRSARNHWVMRNLLSSASLTYFSIKTCRTQQVSRHNSSVWLIRHLRRGTKLATNWVCLKETRIGRMKPSLTMKCTGLFVPSSGELVPTALQIVHWLLTTRTSKNQFCRPTTMRIFPRFF